MKGAVMGGTGTLDEQGRVGDFAPGGVPSTSAEDDDLNSVLGKSFAILDAVAANGELTLSEISRQTTVPKTTTHRLVRQLCRCGALSEHGGTYRLGIRMFEMGRSVLTVQRLCDAARPFVQELHEASRHPVILGIRLGEEVLLVDKAGGHAGIGARLDVGSRLPLHSNAIGKALLSAAGDDVVHDVLRAGLQPSTPYTIVTASLLVKQLCEISHAGYSVDLEEHWMGVSSVASPIFSNIGTPVAAIAVAMPSVKLQPQSAGQVVRAAAAGASRRLAKPYTKVTPGNDIRPCPPMDAGRLRLSRSA
jgi:DNA-binding IclR family transcriptional regulator